MSQTARLQAEEICLESNIFYNMNNRLITLLFAIIAASAAFSSSGAVKILFSVSAAEGYQFENPGELVTISYFDNQDFKDVTVEITDNVGEVNSEKLNFANFDIRPAAGYLIESVVSSSSRVSVSPPPANDKTGTWNLSVTNGTGNSQVTVDIVISKAGAMAYLNFTSVSDGIYNPFMYVSATTPKGNLPLNQSTGNKLYIDDGVTVTLRCDNSELEIADFSAALGGEPIEPEDLGDYGCDIEESNGVYTVTLSPEADGIALTFDVESKILTSGKEIEFTIAAKDFEAPEPYECVSIISGVFDSLTVSDNVFSYIYPDDTEMIDLMIIPAEGYAIADVICETRGGAPFGQVIEQESGVYYGGWQLSLPGESEIEIPDYLTVAIILQEKASSSAAAVAPEEEDDVFYNLQGVPVANPGPGIYISRGKIRRHKQ